LRGEPFEEAKSRETNFLRNKILRCRDGISAVQIVENEQNRGLFRDVLKEKGCRLKDLQSSRADDDIDALASLTATVEKRGRQGGDLKYL